ncbi:MULTISPECIES: hypothetical protein [unclassified Roseobacter]|uniref:hypothetical protein n=1 Tax=unclassified Roseobacter TaxID=196798 RepID=UPI0018A2C9F4|nr:MULTISPECIES: hypothetical protein [unclassified Roseobacter]MDW3183111.1 hypothetical protein [Roseobacter sp.]
MEGDMIGGIVIGGILALLMLRSAVIIFWPGSEFATWCENTFDFVDDGPTMSDGSDAGDGGDGGD